jgi:DNA-binding XRE family transcriptional regulator
MLSRTFVSDQVILIPHAQIGFFDPDNMRSSFLTIREFALLDELLKARRRAGLTQAEVAARMGTKTPAVARLEAGCGSQWHSPSVTTLRKYANAVGCRLKIRVWPRNGRKLRRQKGEVVD